MWLISGWGIVSMLIIFVLALLPPKQANVESISLLAFEALMIAGTIGVILIPQWIYWKRKPDWKVTKKTVGKR
jgi:nitrate reductase gamma subunit